MPAASPTATTAQLSLAFALLYVIWGSTYFAIGIAVAAMPPLTMAALRFLLAGALFHVVCRLRGEPALTLRQWLGAAVVGFLLLVVGNGLVCMAEVHVPTGVTALMVAGTQLFMTLFAWCAGQTARPRLAVWAGILLGLGGVAWLVEPALAASAGGHGDAVGRKALVGELMLVGASLSWAAGSVWSRALPAPRSSLMAAAAQTWAAGLMLLAISGVSGEWHHGMFAAAGWQGWSAVLYLVLFGSLLGYGSYIYLLRHVPAGVVATYAFVNPLIAVLLGCCFGEAFTTHIAEAGGLIVAAVAIVIFSGWSTGPGRDAAGAKARPHSATIIRKGTATRPR